MKRQRERMIGEIPGDGKRATGIIGECRLLVAAPSPPLPALNASAREIPGNGAGDRIGQFHKACRARPPLAEARQDG